MLHTVVDFNDIFNPDYNIKQGICRSSNPYDYIRNGFYLDNAELFGGHSNVSYSCDFSSLVSGFVSDSSDK